MRLINADALLEKAWDVPFETENAHFVQVVDVGDIMNAPTISPDILRAKGRWIWCKNHYECSNCRGSRFHDLVLGLDAQYCGRCGAYMIGVKDNAADRI